LKKSGDFKEKKFVLFKENLLYHNPGEKGKKVSVIPLVNSTAYEIEGRGKDKNLF